MTPRDGLWLAFVACVIGGVALDLLVGGRRGRTTRVAVAWTAGWVALALAFASAVAIVDGRANGLAFVTGYAMEVALSADNLLVILLIFTYLDIPERSQHRVLFWGVIGAVVLRGLFVVAGAAALARFVWVGPVLGLVVGAGGVRLAARSDAEAFRGARDPVLRLVRRVVPLTDRSDGDRFLVRAGPRAAGATRWLATPLLLALVLIETTDLVFAVDSVPAVFGVTRDAFVVLTSNIFAVIGLRSFSVVLAAGLRRVRYLRIGVAVVLVLIGIKMLAGPFIDVPPGVTLAVVVGLLAAAVAGSLLFRP